jgi:ABC-2 type transport system ATP-binding protein
MIRTEKLVKTYGQVHALDGLDLNVAAGQIYGFLGPNGAGKTTTLRILAGLAQADQGQAFIMGQPASRKNFEQRRSLGVLAEEPAFYSWMTAREFLRDLVAPLYAMPAEAASQRSLEMLEHVGLRKEANRRIGGFSRGMRQRLGLAAAMIHQPQVLLLDEPVSALDPAGRKEVLDLIDSLRDQTTVLFSTHILADVERVCDRVGIIVKGRMLVEDTREALLESYARPIFEVEADESLDKWVEAASRMPFVVQSRLENHTARLTVRNVETAKKELLASLAVAGMHVIRYELIRPSLEDVFLGLTTPGGDDKARVN